MQFYSKFNLGKKINKLAKKMPQTKWLSLVTNNYLACYVKLEL